jgi:hypothetical protein
LQMDDAKWDWAASYPKQPLCQLSERQTCRALRLNRACGGTIAATFLPQATGLMRREFS